MSQSQSCTSSRTQLVFQPSGRTISVDDHLNVLDLARRSRVYVEQTCNGAGTCGKCQVIIRGAAPPPTQAELNFLSSDQIASGLRLACQVVPNASLEIQVPEVGPLDILSDGLRVHLRRDPPVAKHLVVVPQPSVADQRDDLERLLGALHSKGFASPDLSVLQALPTVLREANWRVTVVEAREAGERRIISVEPGDTSQTLYGVAFDIGTTTVVGYLWDLSVGKPAGVCAAVNPQTSYGADVIARIHHVSKSAHGIQELRKAITGGVNELVAELCEDAGISARSIYAAVFAGNTVMLHLLLGLPVENIAQAPYIPVVRSGINTDAVHAWLKIHPQGTVFILPHIASYVGADIVADIVASSIAEHKKLRLLLDFGTNAEIVLGNREKVLACAAAAGPCFEGGNISCGMRASRGAICSARFGDGDLSLETISNRPPVGLCGTGLLDLAATLIRHGVVDETGRMLSGEELEGVHPALAARVDEGDRGARFMLVSAEESGTGQPLYLTQRDIRELQNAKAAIAAGIRILCQTWGVEVSDLEEILLAGAFGNSIRMESAIAVGLLPSVAAARCRSVGNAAGVGAQMALLSTRLRSKVERVARAVQYVELSSSPDFTDAYIDEMCFPTL